MNDCIFSGHCTNFSCDKSCPSLVQTTYLLERNGISMNSKVFSLDADKISYADKVLNIAKNQFKVLIEKHDTTLMSDLLTYCAICNNWKGSQLHCVVYHLRFSQYLEKMQKSWNKEESEDFEYMQIWIKSAKILVISNIDFVNFKQFQSQTLLNLLQQRNAVTDNTTIIVSPTISSLSGDGNILFTRLQDMMKKAVIDA